MAQPVFDDHPLEEYFRQAGEIAEDMPGTHTDPPVDKSHDGEGDAEGDLCAVSESFQLPEFLSRLFQASSAWVSSSSLDHQFAERFKYDVISSSLLSSTISGTPRHGGAPNRLPDEPSASADPSETQSPGPMDILHVPTALVSVAIVAVSAEYYFIALFLLTIALIIHQLAKSRASRANSTDLTVAALNELISAGNIWDSAVNQAMMLVEKEERRPNSFYGPTSPQSPFSSLRVTLQSSLHTTQNQCDNVRQLLSALTSPTQASQLSEMYAPSSPVASSFMQLDHPRPLSDPVTDWRRRTTSFPQATTHNKRATWNGSYVALAQASKQLLNPQRPDKRRSDLSLSFNAAAPPHFPSMSAPTSPLPLGKVTEVQEEDYMSDDEDALPHIPELSEAYFGVDALDLRRKRRSAGLSALRMSRPPSYSSEASLSRSGSPRKLTRSLTTASRFTQSQTSRNPLSISALRLALHGALSAKRYSCSHLLALRFEDDDDTYWEDVRSMMALLITTFSDASSRLLEALDENEKKRIREEIISPSDGMKRGAKPTASQSMQEMVGFAPMPSHLTRFAAHVDAISSALDDARTHLDECVAVLRDPTKHSPSADPFLDHSAVPLRTSPTESPVLQAYDRLRKELGFALRECERGREHLLNTIMPPSSHTAHIPDDDEADIIPSLVPDTATSDGGASASSSNHAAPAVLSILEPGNGLGLNVVADDATEHLLMSASSHHLPPPGIDQVYEADSGMVGVYTREKSKLSREERIKLAKEKRRESGGRGHLAFSSDETTEQVTAVGAQWGRSGPGGEVVQELKDVIWKVSEKKRRLSERFGKSAEEGNDTRVDASTGVGVPDAEDGAIMFLEAEEFVPALGGLAATDSLNLSSGTSDSNFYPRDDDLEVLSILDESPSGLAYLSS